MHAGEEDHTQPGWTTSRRGQNSQWKSDRGQKESRPTSMVWPTLESRTAKEQNGTYFDKMFTIDQIGELHV